MGPEPTIWTDDSFELAKSLLKTKMTVVIVFMCFASASSGWGLKLHWQVFHTQGYFLQGTF